MAQPSENETESRKRLMMLMTRHQRQIFAYIYTMVPDRYDAEDILQETSLVICEKFMRQIRTAAAVSRRFQSAGFGSTSQMFRN